MARAVTEKITREYPYLKQDVRLKFFIERREFFEDIQCLLKLKLLGESSDLNVSMPRVWYFPLPMVVKFGSRRFIFLSRLYSPIFKRYWVNLSRDIVMFRLRPYLKNARYFWIEKRSDGLYVALANYKLPEVKVKKINDKVIVNVTSDSKLGKIGVWVLVYTRLSSITFEYAIIDIVKPGYKGVKIEYVTKEIVVRRVEAVKWIQEENKATIVFSLNRIKNIVYEEIMHLIELIGFHEYAIIILEDNKMVYFQNLAYHEYKYPWEVP